jgi:hypothetical protein
VITPHIILRPQRPKDLSVELKPAFGVMRH